MNPFSAYSSWLHTRWPAGSAEKLPQVAEDGSTNVQGLYVVGDLTGIPLLKMSAHTGTRAVESIRNERSFAADRKTAGADSYEIAIVGRRSPTSPGENRSSPTPPR